MKTVDEYGFQFTSVDFKRRKLTPHKVIEEGGYTYLVFGDYEVGPIHRIDTTVSGTTIIMWAYGKVADRATLDYMPINDTDEIDKIGVVIKSGGFPTSVNMQMSGAIISSGYVQTVYSGGIIQSGVVSSGGVLKVLTDGLVNNVIVHSGGTAIVNGSGRGATINDMTVSGGVMLTDNATVHGILIMGGIVSLGFGTIASRFHQVNGELHVGSGAVLTDGGVETFIHVHSGGAATDVTQLQPNPTIIVDSGGYLEII